MHVHLASFAQQCSIHYDIVLKSTLLYQKNEDEKKRKPPGNKRKTQGVVVQYGRVKKISFDDVTIESTYTWSNHPASSVCKARRYCASMNLYIPPPITAPARGPAVKIHQPDIHVHA